MRTSASMDANQAQQLDADLVYRLVSGTAAASLQPHVKTFKYSALREDKDCTRLVQIEPSVKDDDPISCTLIEAVFGDRPKYHALSYMWGDESNKVAILLNGVEFRVTQNLFDALQFLRREANLGPVWIDAISINQADIPERNRQLKIMQYVYFRARTVLVWLGKKYARYENIAEKEKAEKSMPEPARENTPDESIASTDSSTIDDGDCSLTPTSDENTDDEVAFAEEVRTDSYWKRVWIIQEIGKANRIQVCFGHRRIMYWEAFMRTIAYSAPKERLGGPYRLDELRKQKYKGGHTLRNLLENHRDAICSDRRDKVYGLVGLAPDARGFPMDYGKREIDVWTDTMQFMNGRGLLQDSNLIEFARMVRSLLIDPKMGAVRSVAHPSPWDTPSLIVEQQVSRSPDVFTLRAHIYGFIQYLGPTTTDIISSLKSEDKWAEALQSNYADELSHAHCESDNLMLKILDEDGASLEEFCHNHMAVLCWRPYEGYGRPFDRYKLGPKLEEVRKVQNKTSSPAVTAISNRRDDKERYLFQMKQLASDKTPYKTGIASSQAEPGDLVCWIPGVRQAVLVRTSFRDYNGFHFQVCGTARITRDLVDEAGLDDKKRAYKLPEIDILMDADTLFVVLAC